MAGAHRRRIILPLVAVIAGSAAACAPGVGGLFDRGAGGSSADPDALMGLAPQQVGEVLGEPELRRHEPPAEVWQYRTDTCVFDLYLYDEDGSRRAVHYQARSRTNGEVDPGQCLGGVVGRPRVVSSEEVAPADPARL